MIISVIGGSRAKPEQIELAEAVGRELAQRDVMVCCGGLSGVMEAVVDVGRGAVLGASRYVMLIPALLLVVGARMGEMTTLNHIAQTVATVTNWSPSHSGPKSRSACASTTGGSEGPDE